MGRYRVVSVTLLAAWALSAGMALPPASADPAPPGPEENSPAAEIPSAAMGLPPEPPMANPVSDACNQFSSALTVAAANYEEFAYATAGDGNFVDYQDPNVERYNVIGRTALREAAATSLGASRLPGLPPEVSDPMRDWSLHATKLMLIMGVRGGGDSLNNAANQLNADAERAQLACAASLAGAAG